MHTLNADRPSARVGASRGPAHTALRLRVRSALTCSLRIASARRSRVWLCAGWRVGEGAGGRDDLKRGGVNPSADEPKRGDDRLDDLRASAPSEDEARRRFHRYAIRSARPASPYLHPCSTVQTMLTTLTTLATLANGAGGGICLRKGAGGGLAFCGKETSRTRDSRGPERGLHVCDLLCAGEEESA